ncbi:hypothetical protein PTSG_02373 [Salpingoeca rosetta]|uniref:CBF1-interacting co-repressor CIR N-terminal domain-containing protein n=1 Tax=Salpingoeca rosetta (strain ATCC 50818 / BSB-021) TaxID=946362 RepID=F2U207_SALR5|nr:uncharacterized protein PTSG_02373 [Salpingoeca rosetta]EGD81659.1 hypothetical protein PTSG_02373 [Salpingoeca rosetta]|eukprot:XP_004996863.1 hypothetical protein PTSG_02373 [Salpingoeca rosetta]
MGGGGLRILPHKSWNVWNFKNRERVRKDEEQAQREEEERQRRTRKADSEVRLDVLRKRAKRGDDEVAGAGAEEDDLAAIARDVDAQRQHRRHKREHGREHKQRKQDKDKIPAPEPTLTTASGHINFFEDLEQAHKERQHAANKEKKKKEELEAWQKKVGALKYLGQTVLDAKGQQPWYSREDQVHAGEGMAPEDQGENGSLALVTAQPPQPSKHREFDPLDTMKTHLHAMEKRRTDARRKQEDRERRLAPPLLGNSPSVARGHRPPPPHFSSSSSSLAAAQHTAPASAAPRTHDRDGSASDSSGGSDAASHHKRSKKHRKHKKHKHKKHKKEKKDKKRRHHGKADHSSGEHENSMNTMKQRQLQRQQQERDRVATLLALATAAETPQPSRRGSFSQHPSLSSSSSGRRGRDRGYSAQYRSYASKS